MNNNANKRLPRFSIIDILLIFIVVVSLIGTVIRYDLIDRVFGKQEKTDVNITFDAAGLDYQKINALSPNAKFYLDGKLFGTLTGFTETPSKIYEETDDGRLNIREHDSLKDIQGFLSSTVEKTDEGYFFDDTFIGAGSEITINGSALALSITITSVHPA